MNIFNQATWGLWSVHSHFQVYIPWSGSQLAKKWHTSARSANRWLDWYQTGGISECAWITNWYKANWGIRRHLALLRTPERLQEHSLYTSTRHKVCPFWIQIPYSSACKLTNVKWLKRGKTATNRLCPRITSCSMWQRCENVVLCDCGTSVDNNNRHGPFLEDVLHSQKIISVTALSSGVVRTA